MTTRTNAAKLMSVPPLEITKSVVCYSLIIWFCFLPQQLASSALNSFAHACDTAEMKISKAKTEIFYLLSNSDQCSLQVNEATLKQVKKFKYFGVAFTSDERQDKERDTR